MARNAQIPPTDQFEPPSDEASAVSAPLIVSISKIQPYERNPRQGRNPECGDRGKCCIARLPGAGGGMESVCRFARSGLWRRGVACLAR